MGKLFTTFKTDEKSLKKRIKREKNITINVLLMIGNFFQFFNIFYFCFIFLYF